MTLLGTAPLALARKERFDDVDVFRGRCWIGFFLSLDAERTSTERDERVGRAHIAFDGGRDEGFDEGPLLGDLAFPAVFADWDLLAKLVEQIGLEIADVLAPTARIAALTGLKLGVFWRALVAHTGVTVVLGHELKPGSRAQGGPRGH